MIIEASHGTLLYECPVEYGDCQTGSLNELEDCPFTMAVLYHGCLSLDACRDSYAIVVAAVVSRLGIECRAYLTSSLLDDRLRGR